MNPLEWFKNKFGPKDQGPKMTRSQRELQDFRNHQQRQTQAQVDADAKAGGEAQRNFDKGRQKPTSQKPTSQKPTSQKPTSQKPPKIKAPKPTPTPKAQNFLQQQLARYGGLIKTVGIAGGVQQLRQGDPTGLLTIALSAPKATAIATGLVLADQRPAGGAIYDENGKVLPGVQSKPLTKEQEALKKSLAASRPTKPVQQNMTPDQEPDPNPDTGKGAGDGGKVDPADIYLHPDLKGPKGNEVGSDSDPLEPGRQGPSDPPGPPGSVRVNENDVVQVGRSLSGANASLEGLGLAPLQDAARFFEGYKPQVSTGAEAIGRGTLITPTSAGATGMSKEGAEAIGRGTLIAPTSAGATGQDASDPQAGISGAADAGEAKRTLADATSGIGPDPRFSKGAIRRASVRAFLDAPAGSGYNAIRARDAAAGISRIPGQEGVLINGEFRQFADGMDAKQMRQAAYAATGDGFATKDSQQEWANLFLKRAEEAKGDTPTAEKPAAPATPAEDTRPGTPLEPVVIPQAVIDRARAMKFDPSDPTKEDPEYARWRDAAITQFMDNRTTKDVFDTATQTWKEVPINR